MIGFALNHSPRPDTGLAPVEIMTGIPPSSPLDAVLSPFDLSFNTEMITVEMLQLNLKELRESLGKMHKEVADERSSLRARARRYRNKNAKSPNYGLGDFVLMANVKKRIGRSKVECLWRGPFVISSVLSDWVFESKIFTERRNT